jgi:hypothetical protein
MTERESILEELIRNNPAGAALEIHEALRDYVCPAKKEMHTQARESPYMAALGKQQWLLNRGRY